MFCFLAGHECVTGLNVRHVSGSSRHNVRPKTHRRWGVSGATQQLTGTSLLRAQTAQRLRWRGRWRPVAATDTRASRTASGPTLQPDMAHVGHCPGAACRPHGLPTHGGTRPAATGGRWGTRRRHTALHEPILPPYMTGKPWPGMVAAWGRSVGVRAPTIATSAYGRVPLESPAAHAGHRREPSVISSKHASGAPATPHLHHNVDAAGVRWVICGRIFRNQVSMCRQHHAGGDITAADRRRRLSSCRVRARSNTHVPQQPNQHVCRTKIRRLVQQRPPQRRHAVRVGATGVQPPPDDQPPRTRQRRTVAIIGSIHRHTRRVQPIHDVHTARVRRVVHPRPLRGVQPPKLWPEPPPQRGHGRPCFTLRKELTKPVFHRHPKTVSFSTVPNRPKQATKRCWDWKGGSKTTPHSRVNLDKSAPLRQDGQCMRRFLAPMWAGKVWTAGPCCRSCVLHDCAVCRRGVRPCGCVCLLILWGFCFCLGRRS